MALYQVGDLLMYGRTGVCRVETLSSSADQQCYVLQPLYQSCSITIPVGNTKVFMRPVISAAEAEELISSMPEMEAEPYYNRNLNQLREHYRSRLRRAGRRPRQRPGDRPRQAGARAVIP